MLSAMFQWKDLNFPKPDNGYIICKGLANIAANKDNYVHKREAQQFKQTDVDKYRERMILRNKNNIILKFCTSFYDISFFSYDIKMNQLRNQILMIEEIMQTSNVKKSKK